MRTIEDWKWERETTLSFCDAEPDILHVWTSQRRIGAWLEKLCSSVGIAVEKTSRPAWQAKVPISVLILKKSVRKSMTPEAKAALAERLAKARAAKTSTPPTGSNA